MALRTLSLKHLRTTASSRSAIGGGGAASSSSSSSSFSTTTDLPRITERRPDESGRGGRASDAGVKVALFGATGFLGRYVSSGLGKLSSRLF